MSKPVFTAAEVNECFDLLLDKGPRLIPVEVLESMRSTLLDFTEEGEADDEDDVQCQECGEVGCNGECLGYMHGD